MQTRISVYKLYTKSKALYIQIHQAAVRLLIVVGLFTSQLLFESVQRFIVGERHESASVRRGQKNSLLRGVRRRRGRVVFFFFYIDTKSQTHLRTCTQGKRYTHAHKQLYTVAHNHSMALP